MTPENRNLQNFAVSFNVENVKHEATCLKGLPSCIYLIITNRYRNRYLLTLKILVWQQPGCQIFIN